VGEARIHDYSSKRVIKCGSFKISENSSIANLTAPDKSLVPYCKLDRGASDIIAGLTDNPADGMTFDFTQGEKRNFRWRK
jgi:hypothetical protein